MNETAAAQPPDTRPRHFFWVELLAVVSTVACVWLTAKEHILCWPTGILGAALYMYVFWVARLYSDVLLQVYFLVTSVWGWWNWLHGGVDDGALKISRLTPGAAAVWLLAGVAGTAALGWFMKKRTRAALPFVDAATTVMSLIAQYLLGCKVVENWMLWIAADVVDTGVYLKRRLYMTSLLYAVLLILAIMGLVEWWAKL